MNKITLIFLIISLISCNTKQHNSLTRKNKINKDSIKSGNIEIEQILEEQLKAGGYSNYHETDYALYKYNKSDLEITLKPIKKILLNQGYKIIDHETFINKVKTVFGNVTRYDDIFYINSFDKCFKPKEINYYDPDGFRKDLYFSVENRIILNLYSLPEIIDYQKDYKEIAIKESKFPIEIFKDGDVEKIYITKWKDIPDLVQQLKKNIDLLVNRNKYLFNDSKASLVWLKSNDQQFLEALVKTFGYVKDRDLLKWVLDRNLNEEEFDKILLTQTCDNKYLFHKEIFDVMSQAETNEQEKYIAYLKEHFPKVDKSNFSDETKNQALYCYYSTKLSGSVDVLDINSFFPRLNDEESEEEFKKNNYYNLPDFKELYNKTRYSAVGPAPAE